MDLSLVIPEAPVQPTVSNIGKSNCTVTWKKPDDDGGSEIIGYSVERKDATGIHWIKCNKSLVTAEKYLFIDLINCVIFNMF